jgi:hypothetical protein
MQNPLSEFADSFAGSLSDGQRNKVRRTFRGVQVIVMGGLIFGSGAFAGYWARDTMAQNRRAALEESHRQDLARRDQAYAESLKIMANALKATSSQVAQTAEAVGAVVQSNETVVKNSREVANSARKAVEQSNAAVAKVTTVPQITRDQVNQSIEKANRALQSP